MIRVYVDPPSNMSRAMFRVAAALKRYVPAGARVVGRPEEADLQLLHVIGSEGLLQAASRAKEYIILQYCLRSANGTSGFWREVWAGAKFVWSYYDLPRLDPEIRMLRTPLGVDGAVFGAGNGSMRHIGVVTSGYVSGPGAEAIEEVAEAALRNGLTVVHVGPSTVVGMAPRRERSWVAKTGLSDSALAGVYQSALWVSGLRHVEGFELPVIEGLACGARPLVFDRPDMSHWYGDHAAFISESTGPALTARLEGLLSVPPTPVSPEERDVVLGCFSWEAIAAKFWGEVMA